MGNVGCAEQDSGPQIRLLEARLGRPSWCSTLGERRRSLRAESLRLRTSGALSQGHMRAAGSIPGGLWPSFPERRAADLATALARTPPGLQPNLTLLGADVPCQAPPNPLPAMPGLESQSKHQQGPSCLLIFHCTPPQHTHTPRALRQHDPGSPALPGVPEPRATGGGGKPEGRPCRGPSSRAQTRCPAHTHERAV